MAMFARERSGACHTKNIEIPSNLSQSHAAIIASVFIGDEIMKQHFNQRSKGFQIEIYLLMHKFV
jgi:hypothetical protein